MKGIQSSEEVLFSWRRCMESGLLSTQLYPEVFLKEDVLKNRLNENNLMITIFENCVDKIINFLPDKYIFLLTDRDGILLKKKLKGV